MTSTATSTNPLLDLLFENAGAGLCLVAPDGTIVRANEEWLRSTGFTRDVIGEDLVALFPATRDLTLAVHARARAGHHVELPRHGLVLNGRERWWESSVDPVPMEGGTGLLITAREVAPDARRDRADPAMSRLVQDVIDGAPSAVFLKDVEGRFIAINRCLEELLGTSREQLLGKTDYDLFPREVADAFRANDRKVMETGGLLQAEEAADLADGKRHVFLANKFPIYDDAGRLLGTCGISHDITGRERDEEALRDSQQRYATMFDRSPLAASWSDMDTGRITDVNEAWVKLTGIPRDEAIGRTSVELGLITGEERRRWAEEAARRGPLDLELSLATRANGARTVLLRAEQIVVGGTRFLVSAMQDITDRKRAEEALRASEERWNAAIENFSEGAIIATEDEQVIYWNPAARAMHGFASAREGIEPLSKTPETFELWTPDGEHLLALDEWPMRRIKRGERVQNLELRLRRPGQGWERFVSYSGAMVRTTAGERLIFLSVTDLTDRRRAERALREADQRKDEFLATLSHELRNPLAPIRTASYILAHADAASDAARRAREVIDRQTEHITRLVDDLLDVTRIARGKIELRRSSVDLREVALRAAEDFRLVMEDKRIAFETVLPEEPLEANVDAVRLTQVIGNLLHNASKFTRPGDAVTLSLTLDGGDAVIAVRDTGAGIEAALLESVFEPFVQGDRTLARTEGGLGLGLALVKGITELHGGAVSVSSAGKGKGSAFVVRLPAAARRTRDVAPAATSRQAGAAARRVLVVDDNHDAADTLADLVRMLGHEPVVAYDGSGALRAAREQLPDLVLCDIGLPGMNGYEVARELRRLSQRHVRIVAVSGYAQPEDVARAIDAGFDGHVAKPPDPAQVEALLRA